MLKPTWIDDATILTTEVGSGVHGIAQEGTDDCDQMGVCVEPIHEMLTLGPQFDQYIYRTAEERTGQHDAPSEPGDLDLTVFSLRKWARLAAAGNPTVILPLYAPEGSVAVCTPLGRELRRMADLFVSKQGGHRFLGYMMAQYERLIGTRGQKRVNRAHLVAIHGYDSKYASHVIRLGLQGRQYLTEGRLTLPVPEPDLSLVRNIRQGKYTLNEITELAESLTNELKGLLETSSIPDKPDTVRIEAWIRDAYRTHWFNY